MDGKISRRNALKYCAGTLSAVAVASLFDSRCEAKGLAWSSLFARRPYIHTRGVQVLDTDLTLKNWPQMAKDAGLNMIAIGPSGIDAYIKNFLQAEEGQKFLAECKSFGIEVEHETHLASHLLPREYFDKDPTMFRENENGDRVREYNFCISHKDVLDIVAENAVKYAKQLVSTTGRYYFWTDDGIYMCKCKKCRQYSDSDQALIYENHIIRALRKEVNPNAQLAHLAYTQTFNPPTQVKPEPGIFLEFAPIYRLYTEPLSNTKVGQKNQVTHGQVLEALDGNLEVFPRKTAKVLEYWMDVSRFSDWKRPAVQLPWDEKVFLDDVNTYAKRGIRDITCYAAWIDADYVNKFGMPPIDAYGRGLKNYKA